ncbi:hypothetical protein DBV15_06362 [Temnothorax longispinosus]|uniref:Uncharacterized protein n=1 Tax=Temnothorax longispinosus TaxID=300112 RepID=A0A4S2L1M2_9HYME|nr:hypothetical protein DBV15_06362 [Temnothorax longispinosus]
MIERNVACCHACSASLPTDGTGVRERLAHLRTSPSPSRGKRRRPFGTIPHHTTVPGTKGDFLSLPLSLLLSSTYYLSSPNSHRSPSAPFVFVLAQFSLLSRRSFFPLLRSRSGSATVTTTTYISTKSFRRTPISARRGGTVARGKLQSSGIKGGSGGRGREDAKRRKEPKWSHRRKERTEVSSLSEMIAAFAGTTYTRKEASQGRWHPKDTGTTARLYKRVRIGTPRFCRSTSGGANQPTSSAQENATMPRNKPRRKTLLGEVSARSSYEFRMSAGRDYSLKFCKKCYLEARKQKECARILSHDDVSRDPQRKQTGDDVAERRRRIVAPEETARARTAEKERRAAAAVVPGGFVELARCRGAPKIEYWWGDDGDQPHNDRVPRAKAPLTNRPTEPKGSGARTRHCIILPFRGSGASSEIIAESI